MMLKDMTVAALTLGCKVNQYETDSMLEILQDAGMKVVDFQDQADVYIVNTCSVTNMADRKSRQMIHKARKNNSKAIVVAAGCYVQAAKDKLETDLNLDLIISNNRKKDIAKILKDYVEKNIVKDNFVDISTEQQYEEMQLKTTLSHTRAYIKVQDGCNQFCSYCIIPYVRGRIRSRELKDILAEVEKLGAAGIKEVVLTGIHISSYGFDKKNGIYLIDVIEAISKIKSIERIRLGSLEPGIITEDFVKRIGSIEKLCPHFHLSLQSGCDTVLARMNRKYNSTEFFEKCQLLRKQYENPALTTDVIVGFPQETQEEFNETKDFLEKINFYEMHIFKYSQRNGTVAAAMKGQISPEVKDERSEELFLMTKNHKKAYEENFVSKELQVLVEETVTKDGQTFMRGHTKNYLDIYIKLEPHISADNFINTIVKVKCGFDENGLFTGILQ